ncbi:FG-GAP-like repeat-containing protein [Nevskia soli]|uniref:FG-GAP-like repeat-containing protein n=1 Tax=Nevskia soli TaxID=418856 RepID=UPI0015D9071E|nr:FG-GAP-like repeat-containing protein [Nevskia soli]
MRVFIPILAFSCLFGQLISYAETTTATSLTVGPDPAVLSQVVTLTATVTPPGASGNVEFLDGAVPLGGATLAGGVATLRTPDLTSGQHALRARFRGTNAYAGSLSSSVSLNVNTLAGGGFLAATTLTQPNGALLASADVNNDGLLDLVWTDQNYNLHVQLGQGGGKYGPATLLSADVSASQVITGDFNGDGHLDIAALTNGVVVFLGNGDGTFQPPLAPLEPDSQFFIAALGDFNNDGVPDLVAVTDGQTNIYLGNGDGTFQFFESLAVQTGQVVTGDFDGDGNTDIALSGQVLGVSGLFIFFGNGSAEFSSVTISTTPTEYFALATGDLNGDGIDDLVSQTKAYPDPYLLQVIPGSKSRTFSLPAPISSDSESSSIFVADFNGDGKLDVMAGSPSSFISLFLGNGDGTLQPEAPVFVSLNYNPSTPVFLDWDGDGRLDIYETSTTGDGYVFLGAPPTTTSLTVSPLSGLDNQPLTVTSNVSPASASGSVSFFDNTTPTLNSDSIAIHEPLVAGTASGVLSSTNLGANYVFAVYTGDATHASSVSPIVLSNLYINTSVTLSANLSTQIVGQAVTFTATAAVDQEYFPVAGTITLYDGVNVVGAGAVTNTQTVLSVEFSTAGTHDIVARYEGQPGLVASTSAAVPVSITEASGGALQPGESLTTGPAPTAIAVSDVNNDGYLDLISGSATSSAISVLLGHDDGEFSIPVGSATSLPGVQAMAVADFDLNGTPDLVVASSSTAAIQFMTGNDAGYFGPTATLATPANPTALAVADFNGDGTPDLAIGYGSGSNISIALNTPGAGFSQLSTVAAGATPSALTVGEFNGDGLADIAVADASANTVSILLGNGDGTFRTRSSFGTDQRPIAIAGGDINADGKTDLVVANAASNDLSILLGNGDGTFQPATNIGLGAAPTAVALGDFNGDGQTDIAVVAGGQLLILYGSAGSFSSPVTIGPTGASGAALVVDALDGQGQLDVVSTSAAAGSVQLFLDDAATTTTLSAASPTAIFGAPVALTATLSPPTFSGSVSFFDGPNLLGSTKASGGKAVFNATLLQPGTHVLTSRAILSAGYLPSNSKAVTVEVSDLPSASLGVPTGAIPAGTRLARTSVADINHDGKPDILYIDQLSETICVELGNGDGTFSAPIAIAPVSTNTFFVADFNEDGNPDILLSSSYTASAQILFGHGDGTFGSPVALPTSFSVFGVADLNHDGHMDVIADSSAGFAVSLGYGDGTFQSPLGASVPNGVLDLAVGDFNQDGKLDVAIIDNYTDLIIMFGNGNGTFAAGTMFYAGASPDQLAVGDFDGDGYPDLAVANDYAGYVVQLFNDGTGAFPTDLGYAYNFSQLKTVLIADVNGDGYPDLVCGVDSSSQVYAFLNTGSGLLDYPYIFGGVPNTAQPLVADFNSDGVPDLLLSGTSSALLLGSQSVLQLYSGDDQASLGGASFSPLQVYAPVGEPITFTVPASGPSATFLLNGTAATTYSTTIDQYSGLASSGPLTPNTLSGPFIATGFITGYDIPGDSVSFHLSNGCSESVSSTALAASSSGATIAVAIYGAPQCSWTATSNMPGVTLSPARGSGIGTILVVLPPNTGTSDITGTVTIAGQTLPVTIDFTSQSFSDVPPGSYDFDAVNLLAAKGITTGCAAGEFCPNENVARDQMAVFLVRTVLGTDNFTYSPTPYFQDVPTNYWAFAYIQKLYELGITTGCSALDYCPSDPVTRAEMAIFIIRARYGTTTAVTSNPTPYFADVPAGAFAFADIQRMYQDGITTGCAANPLDYCPNNAVNRGEMAIFLMRGGFNELLPPSEPVITSINPASLTHGSTATFTITGANTTFQQGVTTLVFPASSGITVNSLTVASATTMEVSLTAASTTPLQPVSIYEQTEPQEAVLPNGLSIQ